MRSVPVMPMEEVRAEPVELAPAVEEPRQTVHFQGNVNFYSGGAEVAAPW